MRKSFIPVFAIFFCSLLAAQQPAAPIEFGGKPFFIQKTWVIGGEGSWDQMTLDASAGRLYIAHEHSVQIVDTETGVLLETISHLLNARAVALDDVGQYGFISDTTGSAVRVFDRGTSRLTQRIPAITPPRLMAFDAQTKLLFVLPNLPVADPPPPPNKPLSGAPRPPLWPRPSRPAYSPITIIDTEKLTVRGVLLFSGHLDAPLCDGQGKLYISVSDRNYLLQIDTQAIAEKLPSPSADGPTILDLRDIGTGEAAKANWAASDHPEIFFLNRSCFAPKTLAIDSRQQRIFAGCENQRIAILNAAQGDEILSLPLRFNAQSLAFDPNSNLLYAADGDGGGTLTVVREHITDSYAVQQELPTRSYARTIAVNPIDGKIYLATQQVGFDLSKPGGIGQLEAAPIKGSFQILEVGN